MRPGPPDAGGVGARVDPAFADCDDPGRKPRDQTLAQRQIGLEDGQVAVVHADGLGSVRYGPLDLVLGMHLEQRCETGSACGAMENADLIVVQGPDDYQYGARGRGGRRQASCCSFVRATCVYKKRRPTPPAPRASITCTGCTMKSLRRQGRPGGDPRIWAATRRRSSSDPPKNFPSVRTESASAPAAW